MARENTKTAIAKYTHCTLVRDAFAPLSVFLKKTYDPSTGAITVPTPLKAWEMLIRNSAYRGGPQMVMYGLAAVSRLPRPLPIMKMAAQKPPKERCRMQGHATRAPTP